MTELQEAVEEKSGQTVWLGEPIQLHRGGDRFLYGWLGGNPSFPARHVHPAVRADAEAILKVTAERDALVKEHADFLERRLALVTRLRKNPDRKAAVRELQAFDGETELLKADIPDADQAVIDAWQTLDATMAAVWPEWLAYLRIQGQEAARQLQETIYGTPTLPLRQVLDELDLIDSLMRLEGIIPDRTPTVNTEIRASFDRHLRLASLQQLWNGELRDSEGERYGLGALPSLYGSVFATPDPAPEVEGDEIPLAVQHRLKNLGREVPSHDRNPVTGIVGELPWTP